MKNFVFYVNVHVGKPGKHRKWDLFYVKNVYQLYIYMYKIGKKLKFQCIAQFKLSKT